MNFFLEKMRSYFRDVLKYDLKTILKVRKCPFCSSEKLLLMQNQNQDYYVWCPSCNSKGLPHENMIESLKSWNKLAKL